MKYINATLGHDTGNYVLKAVASAIQGAKQGDIEGYRFRSDAFYRSSDDVEALINSEDMVLGNLESRYTMTIPTDGGELETTIRVFYGEGNDAEQAGTAARRFADKLRAIPAGQPGSLSARGEAPSWITRPTERCGSDPRWFSGDAYGQENGQGYLNGNSPQEKAVTPFLEQNNKGLTRWLDNGKAIIHAFESADASTMIHETAHVLLPMMGETDVNTVAVWLKAAHRIEVEPGWQYGTKNPAAKEYFARAQITVYPFGY